MNCVMNVINNTRLKGLTMIVALFSLLLNCSSCTGRLEQALVQAAFEGDAKKVRELINSGVDVNRKACVEDCFETIAQPPLIWAIEAPVKVDKKLLSCRS
jgi:hypothetical protein